MKLAIVGSRGFSNYQQFLRYVEEVDEKDPVDIVVSGGAKGADTFGENWAKSNGIEVMVFKPDWATHGPKAGPMRNVDIIKNCDMCLAFWDGESHGTLQDIDLCRKYHKPCYVVKYKEDTMTFEENKA